MIELENKNSTGANADSAEMSEKILNMLAIYDGAGIASRNRVDDAPPEYQPKNIMPDFQSIIVLAQEPRTPPKENIIGKLHNVLGTIAAQDSVVTYLKSRGYKTQLVGSRTTKISLPKLGERAGVGELSPFSTLAVKGHGLRTVLTAIVTDAVLQPSPFVHDACTKRDTCLKTCPALGADGVFDRKKCKSCGACVKTCPVE